MAELRTAFRQPALDEVPPGQRYRGSRSTVNLPFAVDEESQFQVPDRRSDRARLARHQRFYSESDLLEEGLHYGALSRRATEGPRTPLFLRKMSDDTVCASCYRDSQPNNHQLFDSGEQTPPRKVTYRLPDRMNTVSHHRPDGHRNSLEEEPVVQLRRKMQRIEQLEQTSSLPRTINDYRGSSSSKVSSTGDKMILQMALPQRITQKPRPNSLPDSVDSYSAPQRQTICASSSRQDLLPRSASRQSNDSVFHGSFVSTTDLISTESQEKIRSFWYLLTMVLSSIYGVFLVCLGIIVYIADIFIALSPISEVFNIYLVSAGLLYLIFLYIDITCYTRKEKAKTCVNNEVVPSEYVEYLESQESDPNLSIPHHNAKSAETVEHISEETTLHQYCFSQGRHSGSFYLKLGAAVFCFGHLTHYGLIIGSEFMSLTSSTDDFHSCTNIYILVLDIIYPIYSFFQLFFIFKYSNVIINKLQNLGRFALMHCIATSICFWMWTIMRETLHALDSYKLLTEKYAPQVENETPIATLFAKLSSVLREASLEFSNNIGINTFIDHDCPNNTGMSVIYRNLSPYLYPFSIEYSILIAGVLYIIWQNIGKCSTMTGGHCKLLMNPERSNLSIHVDCHSANKGLFAGIAVLLASVVSTIIFFVAVTDSNFVTIGVDVHIWTEFSILIIMTVTVLFAYWQIMTLDVNEHPISLLDDLLLVVCLPAYFFYAILSLYPSILQSEIIFSVIILLQVLQVLIQTPFIIDGLRRCSNTRSLRQKKPGREVVTLLIVCNVALWLMQTLEIKSGDTKDHRYDFYGKSTWTILGHLPVPLMMFYRFHSSVCLVDIWKSAYEPGE